MSLSFGTIDLFSFFAIFSLLQMFMLYVIYEVNIQMWADGCTDVSAHGHTEHTNLQQQRRLFWIGEETSYQD